MPKKQNFKASGNSSRDFEGQGFMMNPLESILLDASYGSTYSAIHGNLLSGGNSSRSSKGKKHLTNSRQRNEPDSSDTPRTDVLAVHYLTTANPSKAKDVHYQYSSPTAGDVVRHSNQSSPAVDQSDIVGTSEPDQSGDRFGQFKRFQMVKRAERPAPFHMDPVGTRTRSRSPSNLRSDGVSSPRPVVLRDCIVNDNATAGFHSPAKSSSYKSPRRHRVDDCDDHSNTCKSSLYSTLMELADDDSYQAHYDRIETPPHKPNPRDYDFNRSASSGRYKGVMRHTDSTNVRHALAASDEQSSSIDTSPYSRRSSTETTTPRMSDKEKERVKSVEMDIIHHLSGRVGPLRHSLKKKDISNSGVVNFEEFNAAVRQLGVEASKPDLKEVFKAASDDRTCRGAVSAFENWSTDIRYTKGKALNIDNYAERLVEKAAEVEGDRGHSGNECRVREERRAMRKVLDAANKRSDPMRVFCHIAHGTGNNEGKGPITGHLAPQQLKEGLQTLGSNLTDKEFEYLLHKVGTSRDGKISLSEFDEILHSEVTAYESDHASKRRTAQRSNRRYSKTFESCDAVNRNSQAEYDKVTDSTIGRIDKMRWAKLQGLIQSNCENLPDAFKNAASYFKPRGRSADLGSGSQRRSRSLGSCRVGVSFAPGTDGGDGVTSSGRHYAREREEREERDAMDKEPFMLPVSKLRDVLSDAGIQLGSDDVERLRCLVTTEVASNQSPSFGSGRGREGPVEPSVSLDQLCDIVGISRVLNHSASKAELADPRSVPMDGGVFSRSIIAPNYSARFPSQSSDFSQSRAAQQLQLLKSHLTDNRLKNFSSSFLSENNPPTPISLDGSRRKFSGNRYSAISEDPSRFWDLEHAGPVQDIMPSPIPSLRDSYPGGPRSPSHRGERNTVTFVGSPNARDRNSNSRDIISPRFKGTSPVRSQSPSMLAMMAGERGRDNYHTPDYPNRRRSSSAPPRSSGMGGYSYSDMDRAGRDSGPGSGVSPGVGGLNLRWATKSLADFIGVKNTGAPQRLSVDCMDRVMQSCTMQASQPAAAAGDYHSTPGSSRPSTPISSAGYTSPDKMSSNQSRGFSLRKSFPERVGYGGNSVGSGGRDGRSVSSCAPYAVNFPDQ